MSQMSTASGNQTYSVKYLGIVDGAMGILSRKMAMQNGKKEEVKNDKRSFNKDTQLSYKPKRQRKVLPVKYFNQLKPILGTKYEGNNAKSTAVIPMSNKSQIGERNVENLQLKNA